MPYSHPPALASTPYPHSSSNHTDRFPFLLKYAQSILSIPVTTAYIEREFSSSGFILNQRRTNLQPDKLNNILSVPSIKKQLHKK
jgi:hypothetical protein